MTDVLRTPATSGGASGLTVGSVIFVGTGPVLAQDNSNLFWDDANNRLCIGTNTSTATLTLVGDANVSGSETGTYPALVGQGASTEVTFHIRPTAVSGRHYAVAGQIDASSAGAGDKVGIYGAAQTGSGDSDVWAGNMAVVRLSGHTARNVQGLEVDFNNDDAHATGPYAAAGQAGWGVNITSGGTYRPDAALYIDATGTNKWNVGVDIKNVQSIGVSVNRPSDALLGLFVGKHLANNTDGLLLQRSTDTLPTGNFLRFVNAANNANLAIMNVAGDFTIAGAASVAGLVISSGALDHDGTTIGFFGVTPAVRATTYAASNVTTDRTYDANATTTDELADVLGTLIADLRTYGLVT